MNFADVKSIEIPEGIVAKIAIGGATVWQKQEDVVNLWDLANRSGTKVAWNGAGTAFSYDTAKYYYPASRAGAYNQNGATISGITIGEDSLAFTCSAGQYGIAVPFRLTPGKSYTLKCNKNSVARIYQLMYNTSNVYTSFVNIAPDSTNNSVSYTFTATDAITVIHFSMSGSNVTPEFTGIQLLEN